MEKNNQSVDIKSLSKEQRAALMAQLQQEEKEAVSYTHLDVYKRQKFVIADRLYILCNDDYDGLNEVCSILCYGVAFFLDVYKRQQGSY